MKMCVLTACVVAALAGDLTAQVRGSAPQPAIVLDLVYPAGRSPAVFTRGWLFGASCTVGGVDMSGKVQWSGSGVFSPQVGERSRPAFLRPGPNRIVLTIDLGGGAKAARTFEVTAVSPDKYACAGDRAVCPADFHGCPSCPHNVAGPIETGSPTVTVRDKPAARVGDKGRHAACCGPGTFEIVQGDPQVLIDGKPAARLGDKTRHCGGAGTIAAKPAQPPPDAPAPAAQPDAPNPGPNLDLAALPWTVESTWANGAPRRRAARTPAYQVEESYAQAGPLTARTIEPIDPSQGRTVHSYKFHPNGRLRQYRYAAIGIGDIAPALEFYDDGKPKRRMTYHPAQKDARGAFVRKNNDLATDTEWFPTGRVKFSATRDLDGNGSAERFIPDGRKWYTETYRNNVAVRREEHLKPADLKDVPLD